jgi:hypothetical protein
LRIEREERARAGAPTPPSPIAPPEPVDTRHILQPVDRGENPDSPDNNPENNPEEEEEEGKKNGEKGEEGEEKDEQGKKKDDPEQVLYCNGLLTITQILTSLNAQRNVVGSIKEGYLIVYSLNLNYISDGTRNFQSMFFLFV